MDIQKTAGKMAEKNKKVIIVGCGIAGLAAALKLSYKGLKVEVYDKNDSPGGKLRAIPSLIGPIDAGPTVFTLKPWFDQLFEEIKERLENHLTISEQLILARHWWPDGSMLDLMADFGETLESIRKFSGEKSAKEFENFYKKTKSAFDIFEGPIMRSAKIDYRNLLTVVIKNYGHLSSLLLNHRNMWQYLSTEFSDPRLRQLFARYATYVGTSPMEAPALLSLVWQAEARGVWQILGGMHKLPGVMEQLARKNGATFKYQTEIKSIETKNKCVTGVLDENNNFNEANGILFNGDPAAIRKGMLGPRLHHIISPRAVRDRSLSAFVWSFSAKPKGRNLSLHNVFFNTDYTSEFKEIKNGEMPRDPSIYVCAQDRGVSPNIGGTERFEIIINAAPVSDKLNAHNKKVEFEKCKKVTFQTLKKMGLEFLQTPSIKNLTTPTDFQKMFPGSDGSLYGLNLSRTLSTFRRPKVRTTIKGLYLAGGGVHPGPGVPMALSSGKHAAEMMLKDLSLT